MAHGHKGMRSPVAYNATNGLDRVNMALKVAMLDEANKQPPSATTNDITSSQSFTR